MARNLRKYGYAPNRFRNTFLDLVVYMAQLHRNQRARAARTPEQQLAAITPMRPGERVMAYYRGNGTPRQPLTPRQQRRIRHKRNAALSA